MRGTVPKGIITEFTWKHGINHNCFSQETLSSTEIHTGASQVGVYTNRVKSYENYSLY
jgi:hypothetical protein